MSWLLTEGFYDEDRSLVVKGMLGKPSPFSRDSNQPEHFSYTKFGKATDKSFEIERETSPGDVVSTKLRGVGQFGLFTGISCNRSDWKVTIYADSEKTEKIAEITG